MIVVSLGAGVQSTAMLVMALEGRFGDPPQAAVFADTGCEPKSVYGLLDRLTVDLVGFPVYKVGVGNLGEDYLNGVNAAWIPVFSRNKDGEVTMLKRQCTRSYKIRPIRRKVKSLVGRKGKAEMLIGISTDEAHRMKPSGVQWLTNRHPLIDAGLSRAKCAEYLSSLGLPVVKSACVFCPYKSDASWLRMKKTDPEGFDAACDFDDRLRVDGLRNGFDSLQFLHKSLKPLRKVEFLHETQASYDEFGNECEGMCGV